MYDRHYQNSFGFDPVYQPIAKNQAFSYSFIISLRYDAPHEWELANVTSIVQDSSYYSSSIKSRVSRNILRNRAEILSSLR